MSTFFGTEDLPQTTHFAVYYTVRARNAGAISENHPCQQRVAMK
jgi:hypothetical protein